MVAALLGLFLLTAQHESIPATVGGIPPPRSIQPEELSSPIPFDPDRGGLYLLAGFGSGSLAGPNFGGGWRFLANSSRAVWCGPGSVAFACAYRKLLFGMDGYRCCLTGGTQSGIQNECYLGYGLAAAMDLSFSLTPFRPGILLLSLDWCASEGVVFSFILDPLGGGCAVVGARLVDPEETLDLLQFTADK